jgi:hypothetical protein
MKDKDDILQEVFDQYDQTIQFQNEIIQKLIALVEHYGNCYNHDLTTYHEYRVAKKYLDNEENL